MKWSRLVATVALGSPWWAAEVPAQEIRGRVLGDGERPLRAAYVSLEGAERSTLARTLTDPSGRFILSAPSPGAYTVRAEYIGHATASLDVAVGQDEASQLLEIRLQPRALELEGLTVASGRQCDAPPEVARRVVEVWNELRKAMRVTALVEERGLFEFDVERWTRTLDPNTLRVREERRRPRSGFHAGSPFASLSAERLAVEGYVQGELGDETLVYYAPDASVLMSSTFQDTHCFGFTDRAPEDTWAGLRFEPRDTDRRDVLGTLWFDRETFAPERLDFDFSRLPWALEDGDPVGGRVEFARLPEGPWIVRRWWLRMPVVEERRFRFGPGDTQVRYGLAAVVEEGGVVREVRADEARVQAFQSGGLQGRVVDRPGGQAVADATVTVRGTPLESRTETDGNFVIPDVPAGRYELVVSTPSLDSLGAPPTTIPVVVRDGQITNAELRIPSVASAVMDLCSATLSEDGQGVVIGIVEDAEGRPLSNVALTVDWLIIRWLNPAVDATYELKRRSASVPVRTGGRFFLCGLEKDRPYWVGAAAPGYQGDTVTVRLDGQMERLGLKLSRATEDALELEPLTVEVESSERAANRRSGSNASFAMSRADIETAMRDRAASDLGQLLKAETPSQIHLTTLNTGSQYIGSCIVYGRRIGRARGGARCAQVVLDGAWLSSEEAARLLDTMPLSEIGSVEFISPQDATFRFGTARSGSDQANGVVLIRTRRD